VDRDERRRLLLRAGGYCLLGGVVYGLGLALHAGTPFAQSRFPYFVYYAQALLQGQLHFAEAPPALLDLARFEGRLYMHHPPFPALLLAPWVAVAGLGVPDRLASVAIGALNGGAFYALLARIDRRGGLPVPEGVRALLTLCFLFGSVHFYLAVTGNPWELAHVVCNALVLLALHLALSRQHAGAALAFVAILFTRTHVFLALPALLLAYWLREAGVRPDPRERLRGALPMLAIALAGVGLLLAFNAARFGDPFENGVRYHAMHETFRTRFEATGYFDWSYLPRNLRALLLLPPRPIPEFPFLAFSPEGLGVFFASPIYLYLFASLRRETRRQAALLWAALLPPLVPVLLLMGTGELQFGHRYSSDLQVFALLLCALALRGRASPLAVALAVLSIAINGLGAFWFVSGYA
jgi:hypothetical protein